jgi:excisionase family DNA binding protein
LTFEDHISAVVERAVARAIDTKLRPLLEQLQGAGQRQASPSLLSVDQVAERCHVTAKTVRCWIQSGSLGARRAGGRRYVVTPGDLERFLAQDSPQGAVPDVGREVSRILSRVGGPNG